MRLLVLAQIQNYWFPCKKGKFGNTHSGGQCEDTGEMATYEGRIKASEEITLLVTSVSNF